MGQAISLYEISKEQFDILAQNPSCFEEEMTEQYEVFDQNFEGVLFVLQKTVSDEYKEVIQEVFYPNDSVGESIDFDNIKDESIFKETLISYLPPKRVKFLNEILNNIDKECFLSQYNSTELNENRIYPSVWNDEKASDSAFNKRHLEEDFDSLRFLFNDASSYENYIIMFMG